MRTLFLLDYTKLNAETLEHFSKLLQKPTEMTIRAVMEMAASKK